MCEYAGRWQHFNDIFFILTGLCVNMQVDGSTLLMHAVMSARPDLVLLLLDVGK